MKSTQKADIAQMNTTTWNADFAAYAKMRILIVDDEPANVALFEDMLSDQSYVQS